MYEGKEESREKEKGSEEKEAKINLLQRNPPDEKGDFFVAEFFCEILVPPPGIGPGSPR